MIIDGKIVIDQFHTNGGRTFYNTFLWPDLTTKGREQLTKTGQAILDARKRYPDAKLVDLYDPYTMPPSLRKTHQANDLVVDKLYPTKPFESERERIEFLFMRYDLMLSCLRHEKWEPLKLLSHRVLGVNLHASNLFILF